MHLKTQRNANCQKLANYKKGLTHAHQWTENVLMSERQRCAEHGLESKQI